MAWAGACWVLGWEVKFPKVNKGQAKEKGSPHTLVPSFHMKSKTARHIPPTHTIRENLLAQKPESLVLEPKSIATNPETGGERAMKTGGLWRGRLCVGCSEAERIPASTFPWHVSPPSRILSHY